MTRMKGLPCSHLTATQKGTAIAQAVIQHLLETDHKMQSQSEGHSGKQRRQALRMCWAMPGLVARRFSGRHALNAGGVRVHVWIVQAVVVAASVSSGEERDFMH